VPARATATARAHAASRPALATKARSPVWRAPSRAGSRKILCVRSPLADVRRREKAGAESRTCAALSRKKSCAQGWGRWPLPLTSPKLTARLQVTDFELKSIDVDPLVKVCLCVGAVL